MNLSNEQDRKEFEAFQRGFDYCEKTYWKRIWVRIANFLTFGKAY